MSTTKLGALFAAIATTSQAIEDAMGLITINPDTRMFEDPNHRTIIFHGQNVVYKVDPFIPS